MSVDTHGIQLDPFPWYKTMRHTAPVYYDNERWSWNVFRFEDVQRVLSDFASFSSQFGGGRDDPSQPLANSMISTDPPRHRQLRTLVTQAFTPRSVENLAPRIASIVDELLDGVMSRGGMDVVADLGVPLPVTVIAELLGIPVEDRERFKYWSDAVVSNAGSDGTGYPGDASREMASYFITMIDQRRREPGEDLISGLLRAEIEGQRLTMPEMLGFGSLLLVAGNETTTNLIGNALMCFTERPELWERLRAEPDLLPQVIEEVLRYRSPVQSMYRIAITDSVVSGQVIPAGSFVVAWIGSANHDEAQFDRPDEFIVERPQSRHLAFGHGIHYCLGAPLARLEARIALGAMLKRFRTVQRVPGVALQRQPSMIVYGLRSLPITFTPA